MPRSATSEKRHWDRFWDGAREAEDVYSNEGRVSDRIAAVVPVAGARVLEVGAGTGRDGIALARSGALVVSLDYSMRSLAMIRAQAGGEERISLCCGDAFALPFADGTFDVVFHQGLLEHFRNPGDLIAENVRVLKRGGILLVDVPQRYHYYTVIKHLAISLGVWFAGWEREFSIRELESLLDGSGITVVSSYGEWFNPPIWYRMLRRGLLAARIRLPMHPRVFTALWKATSGMRERAAKSRAALYTTVVIGCIGRKGGAAR